MTTDTAPTAAPRPDTGARRVARAIADNTIAGFAPWIIMSVVASLSRFELAVGLALASSLILLGLSRYAGASIKLLEWLDAALFAVLAVIGAVAAPGLRDWLQTWAGELSNIALVVIALGSMLVRHPFTIDYAREQTPRQFWHTPAFLRVNYIITGVWALAFLVSAVSGFIGDFVLDNSNDIWTGWVIQIGALLVAVQFTLWYPKVVRAKGRRAAGVPTDPPPPVSELLVGCAAYLPAVGIIALVFDAGPWWVGVGLIVAGAAIAQQAHQGRTGRAEPAES